MSSVRVSKETGVWWRGALWAAPCPAPALATSHSQAPPPVAPRTPARADALQREQCYIVTYHTALHVTQS